VGEAIRCAWCVADKIRQPADCLKLSVCLDHFSRHFKGHSPAEECCQNSTLYKTDATWTLYEASKGIEAVNAVTLLQQQQTHFMELMNLMTQQHTESLAEHLRTQTMVSEQFAQLGQQQTRNTNTIKDTIQENALISCKTLETAKRALEETEESNKRSKISMETISAIGHAQLENGQRLRQCATREQVAQNHADQNEVAESLNEKVQNLQDSNIFMMKQLEELINHPSSNTAVLRELQHKLDQRLKQGGQEMTNVVQQVGDQVLRAVRNEAADTRNLVRNEFTYAHSVMQKLAQSIEKAAITTQQGVANAKKAILAQREKVYLMRCPNDKCTVDPNLVACAAKCFSCDTILQPVRRCVACGVSEEVVKDGSKKCDKTQADCKMAPVLGTAAQQYEATINDTTMTTHRDELTNGSRNRLLVALEVEHRCMICLEDLELTTSMTPLFNPCNNWMHVMCNTCGMKLQVGYSHEGTESCCPYRCQNTKWCNDDIVYTALLRLQGQHCTS
jgi:hypothetical protein